MDAKSVIKKIKIYKISYLLIVCMETPKGICKMSEENIPSIRAHIKNLSCRRQQRVLKEATGTQVHTMSSYKSEGENEVESVWK